MGEQGISRRQLLRRGAAVGGLMAWTVPTVQTINMAAARAQVSPPPPEPSEAFFLVLDDEAIDIGDPPNSFTAADVLPAGGAWTGQRGILPFFLNNVGTEIDLWSGQMGDEGWFALKTIPATWDAAGPGSDGLQNYIAAGPGLGSGETLLDKVPDVTPLRADGLCMLVGKTVAALVKDSDVGMNYGPLEGNLQGAYKGKVAFEVMFVTQHPNGGNSLPVVHIKIADAASVFAGTLTLFQNAPTPIDSSLPVDVIPCAAG